MVIVVGRPGLDDRDELHGTAGGIAAAAAGAGARVELVGSVGDDPAGDAAILALGRAGVGHAAVLRDPAGATPRAGAVGVPPRLDAADLELGLAYLPECRVLVLGEPLDRAATEAVSAAARYHGAALVVVAAPGAEGAPVPAPPDATVLAAPENDDGAFAGLVGRYAAGLAAGRSAADAWHDAVAGSGWEATE